MKTLSEKVFYEYIGESIKGEEYEIMFKKEDVKQFIKDLKEKLHGVIQEYPGIEENIDKLAGDKLI